MSDASLQENVSLESLVAGVADEFMARQRKGERPNVEEYAARHPEAADLLRKVLTALEVVGLSLPGSASLPDNELSGVLGDFRLLREVGRGGMGVVYEAEQISLRRRVALKVLPFAATMDARHLQRFHNEAQAAACLHHTNIVPVFFVGCERGVHFYAMQFIDGQPLSDLIRQLSGREKTAPMSVGEVRTEVYQPTPGDAPATMPPGPELTPLTDEGRRGRAYFRKVAELGVQAAEALDHAHQLGIVHRDIKPANLLLDGRGNLWVTDFGLAHIQQSEANLTVTGQALGTPRYMSPEQALAQRVPIDHRTDVYSLGATLYELLTLRPAFWTEDRQELLRQIAYEEPSNPRRLERAIPAELEIIVLKAMEKRPQDRYATAKELADDLRRWLKNEPIWVRRSGMIQRAVKWGRRHRPLVVAAVLCLLLALVLLAISNVVIWHEHEETKEALLKARIHEQEVSILVDREVRFREEVEVKLQRSLEVMDCTLTALEEPFPEEENEAARTYKAVSDLALKFYRDLLPIETHSPSLLWEMTWAYVRLGNLYALHNRFDEAQQAYISASINARHCLALYPNHSRITDDGKAKTEILSPLSLSLLPADEFCDRPAIEKDYHRALVHWRKTSPEGLGGVPDYRVTIQTVLGKQVNLSQRISLWERVVRDLPVLANVWCLLGLNLEEGGKLWRDGQVEEATAIYHRGMKQVERAIHDPVFSSSLTSSSVTADLYGAFTSGRDWRKSAAPWFDGAEHLAQSLFEFGYELDDRGMCADAEAAIRASLILYERLIRHQPDGCTYYYYGLAHCHLKLGNLLREDQCRHSEYVTAVRYFAKALALIAAKPKLAGYLHLVDCRYNAACAAALAGCVPGEAVASLGDTEGAHLRSQALEWLWADLEAWQKLLEMNPGLMLRINPGSGSRILSRFEVEMAEIDEYEAKLDWIRPLVAEKMQHWLADRALDGVRGEDALRKLPEAERPPWQKLWQEVKALRQQAAAKTKPPTDVDQPNRKEESPRKD